MKIKKDITNPVSSRLSMVLVSLIALLGSSVFSGAESGNVLQNGDFKAGSQFWNVYCHAKQSLKSEVVGGPEAGSSALCVTIQPEEGMQKWKLGASQPINCAITTGQLVTLRFMARSPEGLKIGAMVHQSKEPHHLVYYKSVTLTSEWALYEFSEPAQQALALGEGAVEFFLSYGIGQVEISSVEVILGE